MVDPEWEHVICKSQTL